MDKSKKDREWHVKAVKGDKHTLVLSELQTSTLYYFKIQARNDRGYGPFSPIASATTGQSKMQSNLIYSVSLLRFLFPLDFAVIPPETRTQKGSFFCFILLFLFVSHKNS